VLSLLGHVQIFFFCWACAGQCASVPRQAGADAAEAPPEQRGARLGWHEFSRDSVAAAGAQAHTPLVSPTKRSSDQRSVDIMLSAATQSESVVLQRKLTGGSSAPSTPSLLETTLSRQMSSFKLDWQINPDEIEFCRDADGKLWQLGTGGYGHASAPPSRAPLLPAVSCTLPTAEWPDCWFRMCTPPVTHSPRTHCLQCCSAPEGHSRSW